MTGFELEDFVVRNGSASELQGNNATYTATITPEASGTVTVDIAADAAQDIALAVLLLVAGARRRAAS